VQAPSAPATVTGKSTVTAGSKYTATTTTDGTGAVLFSLASTPAPPAKMTIAASTGKVTFKVPKKGLKTFSYTVVASNAAGQAHSAVITVHMA
jgi:ribosomal protein S11